MATITVRALWSRVLVDQSQRQSATISVRVPGPNLISPSTATTGLTALHLVGISSDGTHVVDVDPATLIATGAVSSVNGKTGAVVLTAASVGADAAGTAATSMAAHLVDGNPHPQYALDTDLAGYSVVGHTHAATAITSGTLADARLSSNVALLNAANTFTTTQTVSKILVPPQVTGATNPLTIRANTGGAFTEPIFYVGLQGSETTSGIAVRSNGAVQLLGGAAVGQFNDIQLGGAGTAAFGIARGSAQSFNLGGTGIFTFDAGSTGTSFDVIHSAKTSTTAGRTASRTLYSWSNSTDATRSGQVEEYVGTYSGNVRIARRFAESLNPFHALSISATAPTDGALQASEVAFYTDGSALFAKLKNASSTVYTIPLAGSGGSGGSTFSGPINYPAVVSTSSGYSPHYDSRTFPAIIGDGTTDDAAAVRSAIATIAAAGGGTLYMAPVRDSGVNAAYKFGSALGVIPPNVSIKGPFETSALGIGNRFYGTDGSTTLDDSFLTDPTTIPGVWLIHADAGTTTNSFMKPWKNSTIGGIVAYYPNQAKIGSAGTPTQYPWFIEVGNGSQVTIKDLGVTNPYQLIYNNGGWRTVVDNITAQPYYLGVKVNNSYDVSRITRVHFECFWDAYEPSPGSFSCPWSLNFGYAFIIQRCDLTQVMDCFAYGYRYGLVLQSSDGTQANSPWATFTNVHFDLCGSSVIAQQSQKYGASFSNCMFTFNSGSSVVDSQSSNDGLLSFSNCLFVGNAAGVSQAGTGEVNINGCTFDVIAGGGTTFLNHTGGGLYATGNNFRADKPQYSNTSGAASALLVGNRVKGTVRMPNTATIANFLAANNLAS